MASEFREEKIDGADAKQWDAVEEATELLHEERYYDAMIFLREVIKNDAKNPYAFYFLGVALYESGELETARDAYRAALAVAPKHLGARVSLSHVMRELGDPREAIREGMQALTLKPGDSDALHAVGLAYMARGETAAARKYLEAFLESNPEFEVATDVRAMLAEMGDQ
ncbi:MAG: tetratricopeptide repeat protein [Polyangiaceae bacterium]